ncbi:MAG TPA: glycosyl hydrolase family 8 [Candidatus Saccharimonadales bacterium]|nr:glycosyl hydrolase family 8 [Candidatus Saccharimonadales bacterium]
MNRIIVGVMLVVVAVVTASFTAYLSSSKSNQSIVFSNNTMLSAIWDRYKKNYIEPNSGRTLDKQRENVTTSEGQSYSMLRSVYEDDQETFDRSWKFAQQNMQHKNDRLFSYLYGKRPDGSFGIMSEQGGNNSASDADTDIALALILGYERWQESRYLQEAKPLINDIWEKEVVTVAGKPVMTAGDSERGASDMVVVNPSYFAPYAYKLFAVVDQKHDWQALSDNSYAVLNASMSANLDKDKTVGLPPDWMLMSRKTGAISTAAPRGLKSDYGYDAFRTPWRLAIDYKWNQDARAKRTLERMSFLGDAWRGGNQLKAVYGHDGSVVADYEVPAMYGTALAYFTVTDEDAAKAVFAQKLESLYDPNRQSWKTELSYYDDNWAWFGMALYLDQLPNLADNLKKDAR